MAGEVLDEMVHLPTQTHSGETERSPRSATKTW